MLTLQNPKKRNPTTTIEELSDNLIAEVLHRLPLRYLLQCKSLNKRFLRLVSEPTFFHPRLTHHQCCSKKTNTPFLLFHIHSSSNYNKKMLLSVYSNNNTCMLRGSDFLPPSWPQDRARVRVKATHHDLVLCSTQNNSYTHYFVCNPFTKQQHLALPPLRLSNSEKDAGVGFICDQSLSRFRIVHIPIVDAFPKKYIPIDFVGFHVSTFQVNMFSSETGEWSASNVTLPVVDEFLMMTKSCSSHIIVHDEKMVWCMKGHGFLVFDPLNGTNLDSNWEIMAMPHRIALNGGGRKWDVCTGICNGRVKTCALSSLDSLSAIYERVNFEEGLWCIYIQKAICIKDIKLLAIHPHCEYKVYLYSKSKKCVFLCDYQKFKLEPVYTLADDEYICAWGNVMSLVLPEWPTPVPTFNAPKV